MIKNTMLYDCDNQEDFYPDGKLAVPNANVIRPNIYRLFNWACNKGVQIVGSVDTHIENDPEFNIFPPHCIKGTAGVGKIPESTCIEDSIYWENTDDIEFGYHHAQIILEKQTYDIWDETLGNKKNLEKIIQHYDIKNVIVTGLALDICVKAAIKGFIERGLKVYLVKDATYPLNKEEGTKVITECFNNGVYIVDTDIVTI